MASNLRSRPIEGYITDSAGNIVRNTEVIIKESTPNGSNLIDSVKSDDDGYFITEPIKNGVYDIYESGVRVTRQYHSSNPTLIQAYSPDSANIPSNIDTFPELIAAQSATPPTRDINDFRHYIQIEPPSVDILNFGHLFPLWSADPTGATLDGHPFENIPLVHDGISDDSRFTHTRFDVEYFNPLTSTNSTNRRIRWAGIPALRFYGDSGLVLPLDYYSIVPNHPHQTLATSNLKWDKYVNDTEDTSITIEFGATPVTGYEDIKVGDIINLEFDNNGVTAPERFWCIVYEKTGDANNSVNAKMWKSSNSRQEALGITNLDDINNSAGSALDYGINKIYHYQGFFSGIANITQSVGDQFTVTENFYSQDLYRQYDTAGTKIASQELYNYNDIPWEQP